MFTQNLVSNLPKVSHIDEVSAGFTLGKQHQDPFPKEKYLREMTPLELVHSDLMNFSIALSWAKDALTFIDDFPLHTWVYFLKYKSEVFATFNIFKDFIEKQ